MIQLIPSKNPGNQLIEPRDQRCATTITGYCCPSEIGDDVGVAHRKWAVLNGGMAQYRLTHVMHRHHTICGSISRGKKILHCKCTSTKTEENNKDSAVVVGQDLPVFFNAGALGFGLPRGRTSCSMGETGTRLSTSTVLITAIVLVHALRMIVCRLRDVSLCCGLGRDSCGCGVGGLWRLRRRRGLV